LDWIGWEGEREGGVGREGERERRLEMFIDTRYIYTYNTYLSYIYIYI
jgi:hypothetical protein